MAVTLVEVVTLNRTQEEPIPRASPTRTLLVDTPTRTQLVDTPTRTQAGPTRAIPTRTLLVDTPTSTRAGPTQAIPTRTLVDTQPLGVTLTRTRPEGIHPSTQAAAGTQWPGATQEGTRSEGLEGLEDKDGVNPVDIRAAVGTAEQEGTPVVEGGTQEEEQAATPTGTPTIRSSVPGTAEEGTAAAGDTAWEGAPRSRTLSRTTASTRRSSPGASPRRP